MTIAKDLRAMADKLRVHSLISTTEAGSGHPTSCMSCAELVSALFFRELKTEDDFILSKGHAAPVLWAACAEAGLVPKKELANLRKIDSNLEGHPTPLGPLVKIATGSLGQGLAAGLGMSLAKRLRNDKGMVFVLLGDGEMAEGSVWEAANSAAYYQTNNLCALVDANRLGQSQETMHGHDLKAYQDKFEAFGWDSIIIDGHDIREVLSALKKARKSNKPLAVIARTFKGRGVSFLENQEDWHGKALSRDELKKALEELGEPDLTMDSAVHEKKFPEVRLSFKPDNYVQGEQVATRTAFGNALVTLGRKNKDIVVLDGDVKNSTRTNDFFKEHPERGFEFFIAEQCMAGAAMGFSACGFRPFVATFGAFLTRAHDFIRMAQYSRSDIKFVGSHAGISIGEDGPSQMALEDLSMFLPLPDSMVVYPCDAVSAEKLSGEIARFLGISYLRTTREKTPVIYDNKEDFPVPGLKVLRKSKKDDVLIIGAGITVHEALKAYDVLFKKGVKARIIDLYSVKPVDDIGLKKHADKCRNRVVVAEDHYANGVGSVVSQVLGPVKHLFVRQIPRSGSPEALRKKFGIDADAIVKAALDF